LRWLAHLRRGEYLPQPARLAGPPPPAAAASRPGRSSMPDWAAWARVGATARIVTAVRVA